MNNGYVTAVAVGQSQRFYCGVGIFNWYFLSLPTQIPLHSGVPLELGGLACVCWGMAVTVAVANKFVAVFLLKRLRKGRFTSESAVRRFQVPVSEAKRPPGSEVV